MSDDDEGITAVEATGGERLQLQKVQRAGVLTSQKQPEDWPADMWLFHPQDGPLCRLPHISEIKQQQNYLFARFEFSPLKLVTGNVYFGVNNYKFPLGISGSPNAKLQKADGKQRESLSTHFYTYRSLKQF